MRYLIVAITLVVILVPSPEAAQQFENGMWGKHLGRGRAEVS